MNNFYKNKSMVIAKVLNYSVILILFLSFSSCVNEDDAQPFAESFFLKVIQNKKNQAACMIDPKAKIYANRQKIIDEIQHHDDFGSLQSIGGGIYASFTTISSTFGFTKISLQVKLNYSLTAAEADVVVIDRGNGFMINKIKLKKLSN